MKKDTYSIYEDMSPAEKRISEFLKKINIWWEYEWPVYIEDEKSRPRVWTPDFYLPHLGVYIEVCGSKKYDYEYRKKIYFKNEIPIIFIEEYKDDNLWKNYLIKMLKEIHDKRSKQLEEISKKYEIKQ